MAPGKSGLESNVAAALSYVFGWITGILFFMIESEDRFVRFHALQSIVVSLILMVGAMVLGAIPILGWIALLPYGLGCFVLWILLIWKAYAGQEYQLPIIGPIAKEQAEKLKF
jgi:uncharacterized membrane protein